MHDNQRQTHLGYLAGILDADGCFMITKHSRKTPKIRKWNTLIERTATYMSTIKISMIEEEAVAFIQNEIGYGKYHLDGVRISRPNSKPLYQWYLRGKKTIPFLKEIIPYLKVKRKRAEFLLQYMENVKDCPSPYHGLSDEELNYRELSYVKMRELNGNKVAATTKPQRRVSVSDSLISIEI